MLIVICSTISSNRIFSQFVSVPTSIYNKFSNFPLIFTSLILLEVVGTQFCPIVKPEVDRALFNLPSYIVFHNIPHLNHFLPYIRSFSTHGNGGIKFPTIFIPKIVTPHRTRRYSKFPPQFGK